VRHVADICKRVDVVAIGRCQSGDMPHSREKVAKRRELLREWPADKKTASVIEAQSLLGKLLHLSEVVRPGRFFVRRIINQLGLAPFKAGEGTGQDVAIGG